MYLQKAQVAVLVLFFLSGTGCRNKSNGKRVFSAANLQNDMVLVPAGYFTRGCEDGEIDEKPVDRIWIDSFYIDRFPVTNAQYALYLEETHSSVPLYWKNAACNGLKQPVVGVSWEDAAAFCRWRSLRDRAVYTLPTEAQWEKAARGEDRRIYPWGNEPPTDKRAPTKITKRMPSVGQCELGQSPYGVSDLVGNVWNWCLDWYERDYYKKAPRRNPPGPLQGKRKVVRGGNWVFLGCCSGTPAYALRTTRRNAFHPDLRKKSIGFRCVRLLSSFADSASVTAYGISPPVPGFYRGGDMPIGKR